jgi:hypothetical protein
MKSLQEKIEEIRQKPEHIRFRYVMVLVSVTMVVMVMIWLLSVQRNFSEMSQPSVLNDAQKDLQMWGQDVENSLKSLEEGAKVFEESMKEDTTNYE